MGHAGRFTPRERRGFSEYLADRRIVFFVAFFGYAFAYIVRNNFRLTSVAIADEFGLSGTDIGAVLAVFTISYGLGKFVMGILVDRTTMRGMLAGSLALSSLICAVIPIASGLVEFAVLLGALGLVQSAGAPASLAMINFWYPNATRGTAVSIWNTSQNVGAAALAVFAAFVLERVSGDWRLVFWVPAAVSLVVAVLVWRYGRERLWQAGFPTLSELYGRGGVPTLEFSQQRSYWGLLAAALFRSPVLLILIALNALLYVVRFGLINWMGLYLSQDEGLGLDEADRCLGLFEFAAIPAVLLFSLFAWRWPARTSLIGMLSMVLLGVSVLLYSAADSAPEIRALAAVLGGLVYAPQVVVNILTLNLSPPRVVGAAVGAVSLSGYLVGEVLANLLVPRVAEQAGWSAANGMLVGCAIAAAVLYALLRPREKRAVVLG